MHLGDHHVRSARSPRQRSNGCSRPGTGNLHRYPRAGDGCGCRAGVGCLRGGGGAPDEANRPVGRRGDGLDRPGRRAGYHYRTRRRADHDRLDAAGGPAVLGRRCSPRSPAHGHAHIQSTGRSMGLRIVRRARAGRANASLEHRYQPARRHQTLCRILCGPFVEFFNGRTAASNGADHPFQG